MNAVVDVENWFRFEEELVELNASHLNERVRLEAIEKANEGGCESFPVEVFDEQKEQKYWFHFSCWESEDKGEKQLSYVGYNTDE